MRLPNSAPHPTQQRMEVSEAESGSSAFPLNPDLSVAGESTPAHSSSSRTRVIDGPSTLACAQVSCSGTRPGSAVPQRLRRAWAGHPKGKPTIRIGTVQWPPSTTAHPPAPPPTVEPSRPMERPYAPFSPVGGRGRTPVANLLPDRTFRCVLARREAHHSAPIACPSCWHSWKPGKALVQAMSWLGCTS